jgi:hypothetical protein
MSAEMLFSVGKLIFKGVGAIAGGSLGAMTSVAYGTVMLAKKFIDGENHKILDQVQKSEGCSYIELLECPLGVPSAYAVTQVAENDGISWRLPEKDSSLVFWHPDRTFRPTRCDDPLVKNTKTGLVVRASYAGPSKVCENTTNCCRRSRG